MTLQHYAASRGELTQGELARELGISRPYLNQLLNGRRPGAETIARIAKATQGAVPPQVWFVEAAE